MSGAALQRLPVVVHLRVAHGRPWEGRHLLQPVGEPFLPAGEVVDRAGQQHVLQRGRVAADRGHGAGVEPVEREQHLDVRVVDLVGDLRRSEQRRHAGDGDAGLGGADERDDVLRRVRQVDAQDVALLHAQRAQQVGEAVGVSVELCPGDLDALVGVDERDLRGAVLRVVLDVVGEAALPDLRGGRRHAQFAVHLEPGAILDRGNGLLNRHADLHGLSPWPGQWFG